MCVQHKNSIFILARLFPHVCRLYEPVSMTIHRFSILNLVVASHATRGLTMGYRCLSKLRDRRIMRSRQTTKPVTTSKIDTNTMWNQISAIGVSRGDTYVLSRSISSTCDPFQRISFTNAFEHNKQSAIDRVTMSYYTIVIIIRNGDCVTWFSWNRLTDNDEKNPKNKH